MANDVVELYNLALDTIGARSKISLPTEQSREAEACNLWYPNVRDQILASAFWPEATKMARLALLSEQAEDTWVVGSPRPDQLYAYAPPADMLRPRYFSDYSSFSFQAYGNDQRAFMTNVASPVLIYTARQTKVSLWGPELQMAIMLGLASYLCIPLTGKSSRAKVLIEQANNMILAARETAANMDNERGESLPDWIAARGFSGGTPSPRYIYPYGATLSTNVN